MNWVIAGLDPAIHRAKKTLAESMDARVKPAHDELPYSSNNTTRFGSTAINTSCPSANGSIAAPRITSV